MTAYIEITVPTTAEELRSPHAVSEREEPEETWLSQPDIPGNQPRPHIRHPNYPHAAFGRFRGVICSAVIYPPELARYETLG